MFIFEAITQYLDILTKEKLGLDVLIPYSIVMLVIYIIRLAMYYSSKKKQNDLKGFGFVVGHLIMQFILSYVIGWFIIIATYSEAKSLFINYVIAPFIGFISGVYIDHKVLLPLNTLYNKKKSGGEGSSSGSNYDSHSITINVGTNGNTDMSTDDKDNHHSTLEKSKTIDKSIIDSEEFNSVLVNTINSIIENQNKQYEELAAYYNELKETNDTLDGIRTSEMINKKIELKTMIYDCLNHGFATPAENDKITQYYLAYIQLGGNHEVQALYEQHYLKLNVHEDRRKSKEDNQYNIYIDNSDYKGPDRRQEEKKIYTYGELDVPYIENNNTNETTNM
jgi:hypothetical protein